MIGTLYCAKGNFEFGISRIIKVRFRFISCQLIDTSDPSLSLLFHSLFVSTVSLPLFSTVSLPLCLYCFTPPFLYCFTPSLSLLFHSLFVSTVSLPLCLYCFTPSLSLRFHSLFLTISLPFIPFLELHMHVGNFEVLALFLSFLRFFTFLAFLFSLKSYYHHLTPIIFQQFHLFYPFSVP